MTIYVKKRRTENFLVRVTAEDLLKHMHSKREHKLPQSSLLLVFDSINTT